MQWPSPKYASSSPLQHRGTSSSAAFGVSTWQQLSRGFQICESNNQSHNCSGPRIGWKENRTEKRVWWHKQHPWQRFYLSILPKLVNIIYISSRCWNMFGTSEQAVKIYGLWFKLKKHYFCSMFHCRTSKFAGESAIEFPSFLGTNSRSIPDQVLWSKLFVLIFSQFSLGWFYGNCARNHQKSSK